MAQKDRLLFCCFILVSFLIYTNCQEIEVNSKLPEDELVTTVEPITTTTTLAPLRELDFQMSPYGNFQIDVNFVEIRGDPNSVEMIVNLEAKENTEPARYLCQGLIGIYLLAQPNCDGLDINEPQQSRKLATIFKTVGEQTLNLADVSIPYLSTHNCLIVAAENSSYNQIFTTTTTTTETPLTASLSTAPTASLDVEVIDSRRQFDVRKRRQVDDQNDLKLGAGDEAGPIGTDYYDPEDVTDDENIKEEELEKDPDIATDLAPGNPGIIDDKELDPKFGLDKRTLALFRRDGCPAGKTFDKIPLLGSQPRQLTRTFIGTKFGIVLSSGSVSSGSASIVSSSSPGIIYFGSAGSYSFNPLSNWPLIVLQDSYVFGTYGVIIIWALILGAIAWGLGLNHTTGILTPKRAGYVESEMIYRPINRLTNLIHTSLDRFSQMNRRNQRTQLPPKYTSPQVKSSFDGPLENDDYEEYEDDDQFELYENQQ